MIVENQLVIICNSPYQKEIKGSNKTYTTPIYHIFLEAAWNIGDEVMIIHPARCLFDSDGTPKPFKEKITRYDHLKVVIYKPDASVYFKGVDIKGGVAVTYYNCRKILGPIGTFTAFPELNSIMHKVCFRADFKPFSEIVSSRTPYDLTKKFTKSPTKIYLIFCHFVNTL